jgi:hypothetical protein
VDIHSLTTMSRPRLSLSVDFANALRVIGARKHLPACNPKLSKTGASAGMGGDRRKEKPGHCWPGCATPETRT